jgi:YgiT-type zinc finger domain-containing protein
MTCISCDSNSVVEFIARQEVPYGYPEYVLVIAEKVPTFLCQDCGERWTDGRGEDIRDAAVEKYQKVFREGWVKL